MTGQDIPGGGCFGLACKVRNSHRAQNKTDPNLRADDVSATPAALDAPSDMLRHIAEQVADCFANSGYAFVEEDKIGRLAAALRSFLAVADVPCHSGVPPSDCGSEPGEHV